MHLHNVADFAPPGYRLERSDMGAKTCTHRFVAEGLPELVCEGSWPDAEAERAALEAFRAKYSLANGFVSEPAPAGNLVSEAAVRATKAAPKGKR